MHAITKPDWLGSRTAYRFNSIEPARAALLAIDMQVAFVQPGQPFAICHAAEVASNINRLGAAIRKNGGIVAFTKHTVCDDIPRALPPFQRESPQFALAEQVLRHGKEGYEIHESIDVRQWDLVLDKYRPSAFISNSSFLDENLKARGIDTLIVTGLATNVCCESTARDANMLGYKVFFIEDATATLTDFEHNATLVNLTTTFADVRTTVDMLALLE